MVRLFALLLLAPYFEVVSDCGGPLAPAVADAPGRALSMGAAHGCVIDDGVVRCWGSNAQGELGRGQVSPFEPRAAVVSLDEPTAEVVAADHFTCARSVSGRVSCWGDNANQQLGREAPAFSATPLAVDVPVPVARLSALSDFVLALGSDGRLFGWGNDFEGTLARGGEPLVQGPLLRGVVRVAPDLRFKNVSAGQGHACGITLDDALWCWGRNTEQQLGAGRPEQQLREPVKALDGVSAVTAGAFFSCAVRAGELLCWGSTPIADGQELTWTTPTVLSLGGAVPRAVSLRWFHACAVTTDARLFCFGRGVEGQLGLGDAQPSATPREVAGGAVDVAAGFFSTCLRRADGVVACAGANDLGQLGLGDTDRRATPTPW